MLPCRDLHGRGTSSKYKVTESGGLQQMITTHGCGIITSKQMFSQSAPWRASGVGFLKHMCKHSGLGRLLVFVKMQFISCSLGFRIAFATPKEPRKSHALPRLAGICCS